MNKTQRNAIWTYCIMLVVFFCLLFTIIFTDIVIPTSYNEQTFQTEEDVQEPETYYIKGECLYYDGGFVDNVYDDEAECVEYEMIEVEGKKVN